MRAAIDHAAHIPEALMGERIYIEVQLEGGLHPVNMFNAIGVGDDEVSVVQSRVVAQRERWTLAVVPSRLETLSRIEVLEYVNVPAPMDKIKVGSVDCEGEITWEAVLHPMRQDNGEMIAVGDQTVDKWFRLVREAQGTGYPEYVRRTGGMTFAPISLSPLNILQVARFNPLRIVQPAPHVSLRGD